VSWLASSAICSTNSRWGNHEDPRGAGLPVALERVISILVITVMRKAAVLPVPVWARPLASLPNRVLEEFPPESAYNTGIPDH